jgi:hypothetical protein
LEYGYYVYAYSKYVDCWDISIGVRCNLDSPLYVSP